MRLRNLAIGGLLALAASLATPIAPASAASARTDSPPGDGARTAVGIHLRNANSNLCLAARAGSGERPVVQTTCDYAAGQYWPDQYWELILVTDDPRRYRVRNTYLNLCIAARGSGESAAVATTCGTGTEWPDQIWRPEFVAQWQADRFQNTASSNCLAARGRVESRAVATTCNYGWADQHWY